MDPQWWAIIALGVLLLATMAGLVWVIWFRTVSVASGGTGATTPADARQALQALEDAVVPVSKGGTGAESSTLALTTLDLNAATVGAMAADATIPLTQGGTGATTTATARTALGCLSTDTAVTVAQGGTGATTAATARTALGCLSADTAVTVAQGGTGATTEAAALIALGVQTVTSGFYEEVIGITVIKAHLTSLGTDRILMMELKNETGGNHNNDTAWVTLNAAHRPAADTVMVVKPIGTFSVWGTVYTTGIISLGSTLSNDERIALTVTYSTV